MMALVDVLDIIPRQSAGHRSLLSILRTLAPRVVEAADPTAGVWWLVMTQPGRDLNYFESSGSAMFVYSLLKGVRLGYIEDKHGRIVKAAKKAYTYMTANWVVETSAGTMDWLNTVQVCHVSHCIPDVESYFMVYRWGVWGQMVLSRCVYDNPRQSHLFKLKSVIVLRQRPRRRE